MSEAGATEDIKPAAPTPWMPGATGDARTWLFVPGNRPERFDKARSSGADEVICDLEDAVAPQDKPAARRAVVGWLSDGGSAWVRVNGENTDWYIDDVESLAGLSGLRGFMVPKAEDAQSLAALGRRIPSRGVVALIETARGIHHAHDIASCEAVHRLAFGAVDYAVDTGADETNESLLLARSTLVLASRIAGKPAPIDGVTSTFQDPAVVGTAAAYARSLGFGAKLCIHPAQIAPALAGLRPTADQLAWAEQIVTATPNEAAGASALNGQMIDKPVLERARRILSQSAER
jgi:citrate lyase subunit beta/citryl-CoA lyase